MLQKEHKIISACYDKLKTDALLNKKAFTVDTSHFDNKIHFFYTLLFNSYHCIICLKLTDCS